MSDTLCDVSGSCFIRVNDGRKFSTGIERDIRSGWIIQADIHSGEDFICQSLLIRKDEKFSN
jgi:hypothetical protein